MVVTAFLFPGQGSQVVGMASILVQNSKVAKDILSEMKITKRDLVIKDDNVELQNAVDKLVEGKISNLNDPKDKHSRYLDVDNLISTVVESLETEFDKYMCDLGLQMN